MKKIILLTVLATAFTFQLKAQSNSVASGLGLYVFPAKGQSAQTQDTDEADC
jgi:hypothetical protein